MKFRKNAQGIDMIPNSEMWREVPGNIKVNMIKYLNKLKINLHLIFFKQNGMTFAISKIRGGPYSQI